jgi:exopolysaccharide biosynthesis polyprenyl glycosylphosphotransferase
MSITDQLTSTSRRNRRRRPSSNAVSVPRDAPNRLRLALILLDAGAIVSGWALAVPFFSTFRTFQQNVVIVFAGLIAGLWMVAAHELYLARISAIRSLELSRIARSMVLAGLLVLAIMQILDIPGGLRVIIPATAFASVCLMIGRAGYRAWITAKRRNGRYLRDVMLIGANEESKELLELVADHPEAGYRIIGVIGDRNESMKHSLAHLWCGTIDEALDILQGRRVNGVIVSMSSLAPAQMNDLVRSFQSQRVHVQLSNGMRGTDFRRLRATPIAYEPIYYLEPAVLSPAQLIIKRVLDVVLGTIALIVFAPLIGAIALAVRFSDPGPVFFRQIRVGRDGRLFKVLKFRTMVVDAEARLAALQSSNERNGPLFKMDRDPRITRIGHFLRNSSLDELPQLVNVLRGEMSLVGPRPALPAEVAAFDEVLLNRTKVAPGITGLWQVEARDNPSFGAYKRLDLFYVDNWSVGLDVVIILATIEQVVAKLILSLVGKGRS